MEIFPTTALPKERAQASARGPLELLADLAREFSESLNPAQTIRGALERIVEYVGAQAGSLFLLEAEGRELVCHACVGNVDITGFRLPAGEGIIGYSVQEKRAQIVRDAARNPRFHARFDAATGFTTRSLLCAPLRVKDACIGAIELVNKRGRDARFAPDDLYLLQALATPAALAIENTRLAVRLADQERLRREIELAAEIQRNLLPAARPAPFPVCAVNTPARTVSGDFYDFFALPDGRIAFCLGDVSGKGMNAALLMAKTASLYRCLGKTCDSPGRLLAQLNVEICETATRGMFVTMVGGLYDPSRGTLRLANAGHEPPLLKQANGHFRSLPADAPPLGIDPEIPAGIFPEIDYVLGTGSLYVFSDGVRETERKTGRAPEIEALIVRLEEQSHLPPQERLAAVLERLAVTAHDDLTLLLVERRDAVVLRP